MAATYDPAQPTAKDRVRGALGDTDVDAPHHQDADILARIAAHGEALGLAALAHELWARYAQTPMRVGLDGLSVDLSAQLDVWKALAGPWLAELQRQAVVGAAEAATPATIVRPPVFRTAPGRRGR